LAEASKVEDAFRAVKHGLALYLASRKPRKRKQARNNPAGNQMQHSFKNTSTELPEGIKKFSIATTCTCVAYC
jgi:hypothetical protein